MCTVTVAGPLRKGKSYILSEAFDQPGVFPLGHEFDPKTMGIWMWIVPEKYKVRNVAFGNLFQSIKHFKEFFAICNDDNLHIARMR